MPEGVNSLEYDFAYFTTEFPFYQGFPYNDMYVAWLESESWTGNISFDAMGNPISLNAGFLDFKDGASNLPEFAGTCLRSHAGTRWLHTSAPVDPQSDITIVLTIFDMADSILDSFAAIDNIGLGCEGGGPPVTEPVG